jgi:hypothetical protein
MKGHLSGDPISERLFPVFPRGSSTKAAIKGPPGKYRFRWRLASESLRTVS